VHWRNHRKVVDISSKVTVMQEVLKILDLRAGFVANPLDSPDIFNNSDTESMGALMGHREFQGHVKQFRLTGLTETGVLEIEAVIELRSEDHLRPPRGKFSGVN
jgi:hypothetical protein